MDRRTNKTIVLNSSNLVGDGNNIMIYSFPSTAKFIQGDQISLNAFSLYNSIYNIRSTLGNNTFSYKWVDGTT
jgi:hypothetical protein